MIVDLLFQKLGSAPVAYSDVVKVFRDQLHMSPYKLRYSTDRNRRNLLMIHPTDASDRDNDLVRESNGIVIDLDTLQVVVRGNDDFVRLEKFEQLEELILSDKISDEIQYTEDGTVLRVTWLNESSEWVVSTNRRIDAKRVRWASCKTFAEMMAEVIQLSERKPVNVDDIFERDLKKGFTHTFILLHPGNPHVIEHVVPELVYVSSRALTDGQYDFERPKWSRSVQKGTLADIDLDSHGEKLSKKLHGLRKRGVMLVTKDLPVKRYSFDHQLFQHMNELRKNQPTMSQSYLACNEWEKAQLCEYYPHWKEMFSMLDSKVSDLVRYSYSLYRSSFIYRKFYIPEDHPIYYVMKALHAIHKRTNNVITYDITKETISNMEPGMLFWLIQLDIPQSQPRFESRWNKTNSRR